MPKINEKIMLRKRAKPIEYYIDKDGCWICTSHINSEGWHPALTRNNIPSTVCRYVYELLVKKIEKGMSLLHHCDNTFCINPSCMFEGTQQDNITDREKKGRGSTAKLEEEDVREIRYLYGLGYSQKFLANGYGTDPSNISNILNNKTWRYI